MNTINLKNNYLMSNNQLEKSNIKSPKIQSKYLFQSCDFTPKNSNSNYIITDYQRKKLKKSIRYPIKYEITVKSHYLRK